MGQFFTYWTELSGPSDYTMFGPLHLAAILVICAIVIVTLLITARLTQRANENLVRVLAVLLCLSELSRIVWCMLCGETDIVKLLPLHLCGVQAVLLPVAVFSKNAPLREFVCITGLLGGIAAILCPSGVTDTYPFFHFQTFQSLFYHTILILVPLILVFRLHFSPDLSHLHHTLLILLGCALAAGVVDVLFGENYMFLSYPPLGTPLVAIFDQFGYTVYLVCLSFAVLCGILLTYGLYTLALNLHQYKTPFHLQKHRHVEKD